MRSRRRRWGVGLALAAVGAVGVIRATSAPLLRPELFGRAVYDREGSLLRLTTAPDGAFRLETPLSRIAPEVVKATLAYEDRRFGWHPGVDPLALARGFAQTYLTREGRRGGSTLTMQLARLMWRIDSRTVLGKLHQMAGAAWLELRFSKAEILEAYLNLAPYGGNVEGIGAASRIYFQKDAASLTLAEAMALAVMPQNPVRRTPVDQTESPALRAARLRLADIYLREHPGTAPEALARDSVLGFSSPRDLPFLAPHAVERAIRSKAVGSLTLTLDRALQAQLERTLAQYVARQDHLGIHNGAALLVDVETSEVLAHVGSANWYDASIQGQVDGAAALRSPGSTLKPIIYARALDEGLIHPLTLLHDVPRRFCSYNPENFDADYVGPLPATDALAKSRNVPAVELNLQLARGLYEVLAEVQVRGLREKSVYGAGIALGGVEISMEELAQLYVALANGGRWTPLRRIRGEPPGPSRSLMSPEAAQLTLEMLRVSSGSLDRYATLRDGLEVSHKTGTSWAFRDAWTVGVVGRYVLAVWVGNFDGTPNHSFVGRTAAAPLFAELSGALRLRMGNAKERRAQVPTALATARVCAITGKRPGAACRTTSTVKVIPGVSPIDACDVHRVVHVDPATGLRRCRAVPAVTREEVVEVWPSEVSQLFARAGFARRPLPELAEPCPTEAVGEDHRRPRILSPQSSVAYQLRWETPAQARLQLIASADGLARRLTWFSDEELIGSVAPGEPLNWSPPAGQFVVRAVDDSGRSARVAVTVQWVE